MAFTKVNFDKVYAGTSSNKDYCAWYANNTANASAFGVYTNAGFIACKSTNATTVFDGLDFPIIKRASNFLVPVIISANNTNHLDNNSTNGKMIDFNDTRLSDDRAYRIYNLTNPTGALNGYEINNELTASFLVDSLILTNINYTGVNQDNFSSIDFFSIFYNLNAISVYNSTANTGIQITSRVENHNNFYRKNLTLNDLKQTNLFEFYEYNIPFSGGTTATGTLVKYTWTGETELNQFMNFYNKVKAGKIYVAKKSLTSTYDFIDPLKHPQYVNGKIKINYYNSARTNIIQTNEILMSGNTRENIAFKDFSRIGTTLAYEPLDATNGFTQIYSVDNETYAGSIATNSPFYYPGGELVGWTTNINSYVTTTNGVRVPTLSTNAPNVAFKIGVQITGTIYTSKSFYHTNGNAYFYFSNKKDEADAAGLTGPNDIVQLVVNLYPVYKKDANYLPHVVEISPRLRGATETNITDTYVSWHKSGVAALFEKIKTYVQEVDGPRDVEENRETGELVDAGPWTTGPKFLRITHGNEDTHFVQLGSHIEFSPELIGSTTPTFTADQPTGTFKVLIDGTTHTVPIKGFYSGAGGTSVTISGPLEISSENDGVLNTIRVNGVTTLGNNFTPQGNIAASIYTHGGIYATNNIYGERIFNAVFNDYAEYRSTVDLIPGCVVIDQDDGSLACSSDRLQPGAQVISDTFGHCMGATPTAQTPIAVAGRVLVYPYQNRNNYHAGMAVCSAPGGTVDIMTREEIRDYPDCIVGIVSEIPEYEEWGSNNVKVNGRIWIRVK